MLVKKKKKVSGEKLKILVMLERRQSGIRELRTV